MAEAFTAGVKMGGLTNDTEIRILLCYLIKSVGPVTREPWRLRFCRKSWSIILNLLAR